MKTCPKCNAPANDDVMFCATCGNSFQNVNPQPENNAYQQFNQQSPNNAPYVQPIPTVDPYDHTAEFDEKDVHDNKIFALCTYAFSVVGVIIALLANKSNKSAYLSFHIKQSLTITLVETIITLLTGILSWTCIVPVVGAIAVVALLVITVICFCKTCANKSVEAPLICKIKFLK